MSQKNNQKGLGISIGGNVYTRGGDIAGGDIIKENIFHISQLDELKVINLFQSVYDEIAQSKSVSSKNKEKLKKYVTEIQSEIVNDGKIEKSFLEERFENIARMAPDILEVVVATLANPIIGLGMVARKIADKAIEANEVKKKLVT